MTEAQHEPSHDQDAWALRLTLISLGMLAGLSAWAFTDFLPDILGEGRLLLFSVASVYAFFATLLALTGPAPAARAFFVSVPLALVFGGLLTWASFRHDGIEAFMDMGYPFVAFGMALLVTIPFLASYLDAPGDWRSYPRLFDLSWRIVVRYMAATLFTALFWALLFLSDALLQIVGVPLMDLIRRLDPVPWALTGAVFGLALAVAHELRDFVSPRLILWLLRLFLPLVLVVVALFLVLLPFRGFEGLTRGLSPAGTLMGFALASVVLITVAVDRDRIEAVHTPLMRGAVRILATLVPVMAGLALWAVWMRVAQYGWTPERLMAATIAGLLLVYGLAYLVSIAMRKAWMARLREANIWIALMGIVVCLVWLTPLVHPEQISARDHLARGLAGAKAETLPLREMHRDWGLAGQEALAALEAGRADLGGAIADARSGTVLRPKADEDVIAELLASLPIYPEGTQLPEGALEDLPPRVLNQWQRACDNALPEGPGCALWLGRLSPGEGDLEGILFQRQSENSVKLRAMKVEEGKLLFDGRVGQYGIDTKSRLTDDDLVALHLGEARTEPNPGQVLRLNDRVLFKHN